MSYTINKTDNSKAIPSVKAPEVATVTPSAKTRQAGEHFSNLVALARKEQQGGVIPSPAKSESTTKAGEQFSDLVALSKNEPKGSVTPEKQALASVVDETQKVLVPLAQDKTAFDNMLKQSFGDQFDAGKAEALRQQILKGDFSWAPKVQLLDSNQLGDTSGMQQPGQGFGAYSKSNDTIYLDRELVNSDAAQAKGVLLEEMGHAIDARINTTDAKGDEGEIFAKLASGEKISADQMQALKSENDKGILKIDGKEVEVEYFYKSPRAIEGPVRRRSRRFGLPTHFPRRTRRFGLPASFPSRTKRPKRKPVVYGPPAPKPIPKPRRKPVVYGPPAPKPAPKPMPTVFNPSTPFVFGAPAIQSRPSVFGFPALTKPTTRTSASPSRDPNTYRAAGHDPAEANNPFSRVNPRNPSGPLMQGPFRTDYEPTVSKPIFGPPAPSKPKPPIVADNQEIAITDKLVYTTHDGTPQYSMEITVGGETLTVDRRTANNIRRRASNEDITIQQRSVVPSPIFGPANPYQRPASPFQSPLFWRPPLQRPISPFPSQPASDLRTVIKVGDDEIHLDAESIERINDGDLTPIAEKLYIPSQLEREDPATYEFGEKLIGPEAMDPDLDAMTPMDRQFYENDVMSYIMFRHSGIKDIRIEETQRTPVQPFMQSPSTQSPFMQPPFASPFPPKKPAISPYVAAPPPKTAATTDMKVTYGTNNESIALDSATVEQIFDEREARGEDSIGGAEMVATLKAVLPVEELRADKEFQVALGESMDNRTTYTREKMEQQIAAGDKEGAVQTLVHSGRYVYGESERLWQTVGAPLLITEGDPVDGRMPNVISIGAPTEGGPVDGEMPRWITVAEGPPVPQDGSLDGELPTFEMYMKEYEIYHAASIAEELEADAMSKVDDPFVFDTTTYALHERWGTDAGGGKGASSIEKGIASQGGPLTALLQKEDIRIKRTADGDIAVSQGGRKVSLNSEQRQALEENGEVGLAWSLVRDSGDLEQRALVTAMPAVRNTMTDIRVEKAAATSLHLDCAGQEVKDRAMKIYSANMNATLSAQERSSLARNVGDVHLGQEYVEKTIESIEKNTPIGQEDLTVANGVGLQMQRWAEIAPPEFADSAVKGVQAKYNNSWLAPKGSDTPVESIEFSAANVNPYGAENPLSTELYGGFSALVELDPQLAGGVVDWMVEQDHFFYHTSQSTNVNSYQSERHAAVIAAEKGNGTKLAVAISESDELFERVADRESVDSLAIDPNGTLFHETTGELIDKESRLHMAAWGFKDSLPEAKEKHEQYLLSAKEGMKYNEFQRNREEYFDLFEESMVDADNVATTVKVTNEKELRGVVESSLGPNADPEVVESVVGKIQRESGDGEYTITSTPYIYESTNHGRMIQSALFEIQVGNDTKVIDGGALERAVDQNGGKAVSADANHDGLSWKYSSVENFIDDNDLDTEGTIHFAERKDGEIVVKGRQAAKDTFWERNSVYADAFAGVVAVGGVVAAPFTAGQSLWLTYAATAYGAGRSVQELNDMASHGQNWKSLKNPRARAAWLELGTAPLAFTGATGVSSTLKTTTKGAKVVQGTTTVLNKSSKAATTVKVGTKVVNSKPVQFIDAGVGLGQMGEQGYAMTTNWDQMSTQDKGLASMNFGLGASGFATPLVTNSKAAKNAQQRRAEKQAAAGQPQQGLQANDGNPVLKEGEQDVTQSMTLHDAPTSEDTGTDVPASATANKPAAQQSTAPGSSASGDADIINIRRNEARLAVDPDILESYENAKTHEDVRRIFEEEVGDDQVAAQVLVDAIMDGDNATGRKSWLENYAATEGNNTVTLAMMTRHGEQRTKPADVVRQEANLSLVAMGEKKPGNTQVIPFDNPYDSSLVWRPEPEANIDGKIDFDHELPQTVRFINKQGGGVLEFKDHLPGIEGYFKPSTGGEKIPVSFKNKSDAKSLKNIFREIRNNGNTIKKQAGTNGLPDDTPDKAVINVIAPQYDVLQTIEFVNQSQSNIFPDNVFEQIQLDVKNGMAVFDSIRKEINGEDVIIGWEFTARDHAGNAFFPEPQKIYRATAPTTTINNGQTSNISEYGGNESSVSRSPASADRLIAPSNFDPKTGQISGMNGGDIDMDNLVYSAAKTTDGMKEHEARALDQKPILIDHESQVLHPKSYDKNMTEPEVEALLASSEGSDLQSTKQLVHSIEQSANPDHIRALDNFTADVPINISLAKFLNRAEDGDADAMMLATADVDTEARQHLADQLLLAANEYLENTDNPSFDFVRLIEDPKDLADIQPSDNALIISDLPQGLLFASNDFHAHPTDYSRRLLEKAYENPAKSYLNRKSGDEAQVLEKTLLNLLSNSNGRILVSMIPQRCCGSSTHWNSVVANELTLKGSTQLDRQLGADFEAVNDIDQVMYNGVPIRGLEKVAAVIRTLSPDEVASDVHGYVASLDGPKQKEVLESLGIVSDPEEFLRINQADLYRAIGQDGINVNVAVKVTQDHVRSLPTRTQKKLLAENDIITEQDSLGRLRAEQVDAAIERSIKSLKPHERKPLLRDLGVANDPHNELYKAIYEDTMGPDVVVDAAQRHIKALPRKEQRTLLKTLSIDADTGNRFRMDEAKMDAVIKDYVESFQPYNQKQLLRKMGIAVDWVERVNAKPQETVQLMGKILIPEVTLGRGSAVAAQIEPTLTALGLADNQLQEGIAIDDVRALIGENSDLDKFAFSQLLESVETDDGMTNTVKNALKDYDVELRDQDVDFLKGLGITPRDISINNGTEYGMNRGELRSWLDGLDSDQRVDVLKAVHSVDSEDIGLGMRGVYGPAAYVRTMSLEFPGVFRSIGEITGNKEGVSVQLGPESWDVSSKKFQGLLHFLSETGMPILFHNDWGVPGMHNETGRLTGKISGYEYFYDMLDVLENFPDAKIVFAHTGIGRFHRPDISLQYAKGSFVIKELDSHGHDHGHDHGHNHGHALGSLKEGDGPVHIKLGESDVAVEYAKDDIVIKDLGGNIIKRLDKDSVENLKENLEPLTVELSETEVKVEYERKDIVVKGMDGEPIKDQNGNNVVLENHEAPVHVHKLYELFDRLPWARADLSWTDVAQAVTQTPEIRDHLAHFMYHNQDRLIAGTDTVKPASRAHYMQYLKQISPLIGKLALADNKAKGNEASFKFLVQNFNDVIDPGRQSIIRWTEQTMAKEAGIDLAALRKEHNQEMLQVSELKSMIRDGGKGGDGVASLLGRTEPDASPKAILKHHSDELDVLSQLEKRDSTVIADMVDKGYDIIAENAEARLDTWGKKQLADGKLTQARVDQLKDRYLNFIRVKEERVLAAEPAEIGTAEKIKKMWRREDEISSHHDRIVAEQQMSFDDWTKKLYETEAQGDINKLRESSGYKDEYAKVEEGFVNKHADSDSSSKQVDHRGEVARVGEKTSGGTTQVDSNVRKKIIRDTVATFGTTIAGMTGLHLAGVTVPADVNAAAFFARGASGKLKSELNQRWTEVYEGVTELNIAPDSQTKYSMHERLDKFLDHLVKHQKEFKVDPTQVFAAERLIRQFEVDFNAIIHKSEGDHRNLNDNLKTNLVAEVSRLQATLDRVLGFGFASISPTDSRTKLGKALNATAVGTLGVNVFNSAQWGGGKVKDLNHAVNRMLIDGGMDPSKMLEGGMELNNVLSGANSASDAAFNTAFGAANTGALWLGIRRLIASTKGVGTDTRSMQKLERNIFKTYTAATAAWVAKDGTAMAESLIANGFIPSGETAILLAKMGVDGLFLKKLYAATKDASAPTQGGRGLPPSARNKTAGVVGAVLATRMALEILANQPEFEEEANELVKILEENVKTVVSDFLSLDESDEGLKGDSSTSTTVLVSGTTTPIIPSTTN
ncbi:MAG: DUF4781 domain-containing protein [Arenicella sp.]